MTIKDLKKLAESKGLDIDAEIRLDDGEEIEPVMEVQFSDKAVTLIPQAYITFESK